MDKNDTWYITSVAVKKPKMYCGLIVIGNLYLLLAIIVAAASLDLAKVAVSNGVSFLWFLTSSLAFLSSKC